MLWIPHLILFPSLINPWHHSYSHSPPSHSPHSHSHFSSQSIQSITLNCFRWEWGEQDTWRGQRTVWNSCQTPWKSVSRQVRGRKLNFDSVPRILLLLFSYCCISSLWLFCSIILFFLFSFLSIYTTQNNFPYLLILVLTLSPLLSTLFSSPIYLNYDVQVPQLM